MCLYSNKKVCRATKDFIVYKLMDKSRDFHYSWISPVLSHHYRSGLQPYIDIIKPRILYNKIDDKDLFEYSLGYHSYTEEYYAEKIITSDIISLNDINLYIKCIIPKWSYYVVSICNVEIVSSRIIIPDTNGNFDEPYKHFNHEQQKKVIRKAN